jgi:hypothetical protein
MVIDKAATSKYSALFIHSTWRGSSTYIWEAFRSLGYYYCYYDPFNEMLSDMDSEKAANFEVADQLGHELSLPYFFEYQPLVSTGVSGFYDEFSYGNFFVNDPRVLQLQHEYIARLLFEASLHHRQAVLGFGNSSGRVRWMRWQYPTSMHVLVVRNFIQQWISSINQLSDFNNPYFIVAPIACLAAAKEDELAISLRDALEIPHLSAVPFNQFFKAAENYTLSLPVVEQFKRFIAFQIIRFLRARPYVDMVIDVDHLSLDATYRNNLIDQLSLRLPAVPAFDDAHVPLHSVDMVPELEQTVRSVLDIFRSVNENIDQDDYRLDITSSTWQEAIGHANPVVVFN